MLEDTKVREIKLTKGFITVVDDEDYEMLSKFKWLAHTEGRGKLIYAARNIWEPPKVRGVRMHRVILNAPEGKQVDHINGGGNKEKGNITRTYWLVVLEEIPKYPNKYQLLCANCNWIKKYENKEDKHKTPY
jgi:hypothetical protein